MKTMTPEEYRHFLIEKPRTGKIAIVRKDGRPHVTPIWFVLDGENLVFTTWHESVKAHNLRRDPQVTICVDDEQPPYAYVIVEGTVEFLTVTPEERIEWVTRIARRYLGDELAEAFGKRNGVEGEHILRVTPTNVVAHKNIAD